MYQVIKMYGDMEPWWFLEDWKEDIIKVFEFDDYHEALECYKKEWIALHHRYSSFNSRGNIMTAFWNKQDQRWCEECDDYVQQYDSLALLTDWQEISNSCCPADIKPRPYRLGRSACFIKKKRPKN